MKRAAEVFNQNDGEVTKAYYAELQAKGWLGELAVALFRAQKRSTAAKRYRRGRFRRDAYEVKNWSLSEICRLLTAQTNHGFAWGWQRDPETPGFEWVLYVELPTGQVSFHSAERLRGPDYLRAWDRQRLSEPRILAFCDAVADDSVYALRTLGSDATPVPAPAAKQDSLFGEVTA